MGRSKFLFLAVIMFTFLGVTAWSTWNYDRAFKMVASHTQLSAWSLAQLEIEMHRFKETLELYQAGRTDAKQLNLSYDMAWNRLDVFLTGDEAKNLRSRFGAAQIGQQLLGTIKRYEKNITSPRRDDSKLVQMDRELEALMPPLRDLMIQNFTGPNALQESQLLNDSKTNNFTAIGALLLVGLAMLAVLFREAKQQHFLARNDPLTRLPNRVAFLDRLKQLLAMPDTQLMLCLLDLKRFKEVNDSFGHAAGDQLLTLVASELRHYRGKGVYLARIGSDEFAVVLFGKQVEDQWLALSRQMFNQLDHLLYHQDPAHRVRLNMGISQYPQHARTVEEVVLFADLALSSAKQETHLHYQVFTRPMLKQYQRKRLLAGQLREQLADVATAEMYLCYQPVLNKTHPERLGAELLLRWPHPSLGFISPPDIVEIAEENGLGERLGEWIFQRMNHDLQQLPPEITANLDLAINLSGSMFNQQLSEHAMRWLAGGPLSPQQLILELTENIALEDFELSRAIIGQLHAQQIRIALDDFGTGWASFTYLKDLNFDKLKIDKSFIQHMDQDPRLPLFVHAITDLSHNLGVSVVAEGVETQSELQKVLEAGVDEIQGYFYSRPLAMEHFQRYADDYFAAQHAARDAELAG